MTGPAVTARRAPTLMVSEIFGPTLQGEGPSLGTPCAFLRLGHCNLDCAWCDTPYTWDWSRFDPKVELFQVSAEEAASTLLAFDVPLLVVSGGEPLVQHKALGALLATIRERDRRRQVEIETNGTIVPSFGSDLVGRFNVSPKLANSRVALERRRNLDALRWLASTGRAIFKFVVVEPSDLDEVDELVGLAQLPREQVYLMPEGVDPVALRAHAQAVADAVIGRGYRMTTRLQIQLWGNRRGV